MEAYVVGPDCRVSAMVTGDTDDTVSSIALIVLYA